MSRRWSLWPDHIPEVVAFPLSPLRFWEVRPVAGKPGQFVGRLAGPLLDEWEDDFAFTATEVGTLALVMDALKDRRYRQGLPIVTRQTAPKSKGGAHDVAS